MTTLSKEYWEERCMAAEEEVKYWRTVCEDLSHRHGRNDLVEGGSIRRKKQDGVRDVGYPSDEFGNMVD